MGTERRRVSSHLSTIERERDSPRPTPSLPGSGGVHEPRLRRTVLIVSSFSSRLAIGWNEVGFADGQMAVAKDGVSYTTQGRTGKRYREDWEIRKKKLVYQFSNETNRG